MKKWKVVSQKFKDGAVALEKSYWIPKLEKCMEAVRNVRINKKKARDKVARDAACNRNRNLQKLGVAL